MTFASDIMLHTLLALEAQRQQLRGYALQLEAAFGTGDVVAALHATAGLRRVLDDIAATFFDLRAQVIPVDGARMGGAVGSLGELAIRAVVLVVAAELRQLAEAIENAAGTVSMRALCTGRFRTAHDVASFVGDKLAQINELWMRHRQAGPPCGSPPEQTPACEEARARYRCALRDAQRALAAIGDDPDVARFLRAGIALRDWPDIQHRCMRIAVALRITLDIEPGRALWSALQPPRNEASSRTP